MRISRYDRYQALKHSEIYHKDYENYLIERGEQKEMAYGDGVSIHPKLSEPAKKLCEKWGLRYPLKIDTGHRIIEHVKGKNGKTYFQTFDGTEHFIDTSLDPPITYLDDPEKWDWGTVRAINVGDDSAENVIFTHVNGKLVLMINTDNSLEHLKKAFNDFIKRWVKPSSEGKGRTHYEDKWEIYREIEVKGKNPTQVTRDMFGYDKDEHQTYNEDMMADYKRLKRAYDKACKIVKYIEEQAESQE